MTYRGLYKREEPDEGEETSDEGDHMEKLFDNQLRISERLVKENAGLNQRLTAMEKGFGRMETGFLKLLEKLDKAVPPESMDKKGSGNDTDHDPTKEEVDNKPADTAATKPAKDFTDTGGAFNPKVKSRDQAPTGFISKAEFDGALTKQRQEIAKEFEAKIPELIKAHTPLPPGYPTSPDAVANLRNPISALRKALDYDRKISGGRYKAGSLEDHHKTVLFMEKLFGVNEPPAWAATEAGA